MQNTSGMTHPVQCSTSLKETESRMGGSRWLGSSQLGLGAASADPEAGSGSDGRMEQSGCKM